MQSGSTPQIDDYFNDLQAPNPGDMAVQLEELVQQGTLSPEQAQAIMVERSAMNDVSTDPALKQAQMDALSGLQDISSSGGMTAMDRANLAKIEAEENAAARGQREAILSNAQARGMGGSGLELMSQMKNQQDSATRKSQRDMDVAAQAQQRALEALMQGGQMAGNMQGQDFNQKAQVAGANDAIAQFNAQNQQQVGLVNTAARNDASASNLAAKQTLADQNTQLRNSQQQYNKNLLQQNFDNQIKKRSGQSNTAAQNADAAGQDSQNRANATNQTIGMGLTAGSMFMGKGKKEGGLVEGYPTEGDSVHEFLQPGEMVIRKDDVPDMLKKAHTDEDGEFDAAGFLDALTGHKYGYSKGKK